MLIDCDSCAGRGAACAGCLMSVLLDAPGPSGRLTADEQRAIEVLARVGFDVQVLTERARSPRMVRRNRGRHVA